MNNPVKALFMNAIINFRLKKFARHEKIFNFSEELDRVKNILVILPAGREYTETMQNFIKRIGSIFKKARVSTFTSSSLRKSELTWFGVPNDQYLRIIRDERFDLVLDINTRQDKVCSYISALSGAPTRLNLTPGDYDYIYNLHFRMGNINNMDGKLENIVSYLNTLKPRV